MLNAKKETEKTEIIELNADNIDELIDDIQFPTDEQSIREFIEDNTQHRQRKLNVR